MMEGQCMRKPRDYDSELKALAEKAKQLKDRQARQLGDLVIATGANALDIEVLVGALLDAAGRKDLTIREEWRTRGATFFRSGRRTDARGPQSRRGSAQPSGGNAQPIAGEASAS
jgi:hypothetical protein